MTSRSASDPVRKTGPGELAGADLEINDKKGELGTATYLRGNLTQRVVMPSFVVPHAISFSPTSEDSAPRGFVDPTQLGFASLDNNLIGRYIWSHVPSQDDTPLAMSKLLPTWPPPLFSSHELLARATPSTINTRHAHPSTLRTGLFERWSPSHVDGCW